MIFHFHFSFFVQFLEKDELANFSFQKEFLRPFERIMLRRPALATRELVRSSLVVLVVVCASFVFVSVLRSFDACRK